MFSYLVGRAAIEPATRLFDVSITLIIASGRQGEGQAFIVAVSWHILLHLMHFHHWRQGEGHIKDGCFHISLLTIIINSHSTKHYLPSKRT